MIIFDPRYINTNNTPFAYTIPSLYKLNRKMIRQTSVSFSCRFIMTTPPYTC